MKEIKQSQGTDNVYKLIADMQAKLEVNQQVYNTALATNEPLRKIKALRGEIKYLIKTLQRLQTQVTTASHLAYYLD